MNKSRFEELQTRILSELKRAQDKHPAWPNDPFHAVAVVAEEVGEVVADVLKYTYEPDKGKSVQDIELEVVQSIVTLIRFYDSIPEYDFKPSKQHIQ